MTGDQERGWRMISRIGAPAPLVLRRAGTAGKRTKAIRPMPSTATTGHAM